MFAYDFIKRFHEIETQANVSSKTPFVVRIEGHAPMQVTNLHPEIHEDDGSTTLWITAEEF